MDQRLFKSVVVVGLATVLCGALTGCGSMMKSQMNVPTSDSALNSPDPVPDYEPGVITVAFTSVVGSEADARKVLDAYALTLIQYDPPSRVASVQVPVGAEKTWVGTLSKDTSVRYAELNHSANVAL